MQPSTTTVRIHDGGEKNNQDCTDFFFRHCSQRISSRSSEGVVRVVAVTLVADLPPIYKLQLLENLLLRPSGLSSVPLTGQDS